HHHHHHHQNNNHSLVNLSNFSLSELLQSISSLDPFQLQLSVAKITKIGNLTKPLIIIPDDDDDDDDDNNNNNKTTHVNSTQVAHYISFAHYCVRFEFQFGWLLNNNCLYLSTDKLLLSQQKKNNASRKLLKIKVYLHLD